MNYNLSYSSTPVKYFKHEMIEYCRFKLEEIVYCLNRRKGTFDFNILSVSMHTCIHDSYKDFYMLVCHFCGIMV